MVERKKRIENRFIFVEELRERESRWKWFRQTNLSNACKTRWLIYWNGRTLRQAEQGSERKRERERYLAKQRWHRKRSCWHERYFYLTICSVSVERSRSKCISLHRIANTKKEEELQFEIDDALIIMSYKWTDINNLSVKKSDKTRKHLMSSVFFISRFDSTHLDCRHCRDRIMCTSCLFYFSSEIGLTCEIRRRWIVLIFSNLNNSFAEIFSLKNTDNCFGSLL